MTRRAEWPATLLVGALALLGPMRAAAAEPPCPAAACTTIRGEVRRRGDRVPIPGARILLTAEPTGRKLGELPRHAHLREDAAPAWVRSTTADDDGTYAFDDVPRGRARLVVIADGFVRTETIVDTGARIRPVFLEPRSEGEFRTVVAQRPSAPTPSASGVAMTAEEIATAPGTQGDPLRAVQSLPGVARTPAGLGLLILRGASPAQSKVYYGEHPLPRAFHTLGFTSVLQADVLGGLEVQAGNFSSRWGNASGGVVLLAPRKGRRDGVHGHAKVDLLSAGALVEGPLGRGSFMIAAQRGYVDAVLRVAERLDPTVAYALPRYFDYQAQYDLTRGANEFTARWIGSGDRWTVRYLDYDITGEQTVRRTGADLRDQFHRGELVLRRRSGPWRFLLTPAVRVDLARTTSDFSSDRRRAVVPSWRAEAEREMTPYFSVTVGTEGSVSPYRLRSEVPETDTREGELVLAKGVDAIVGVYAWATLRLGNVTLWPGVRGSAFARITRTETRDRTRHRFAVDPRLIARWDLGKRWALRGGVGLYAQPDAPFASGSDSLVAGEQGVGTARVLLSAPIRFALDPSVGVGATDPTPDPLQSIQVSGGGSFTPARGPSVDATAFVRILDEPRTTAQRIPGGPETIYTVESIARTWGLELLLRQRLGERFYGWIGYTLMRTEFGAQYRGLNARRYTASSFDQRHNLVVLASAELPRHFRLGARFRLVSGSPYTPVVGTVNGNNGPYPLLGGTNSRRFPAFHQLDVRLDRRWYLRRTTVAAYVDVQNVYNRANVEALVYSADYREIVSSVGLPIFPSLGVRVDW